MKIFIVATVLHLSFSAAFSQTKGDNTIIVKHEGGKDSLFTAVGSILMDQGYFLTTTDKTFYLITTDLKEIKIAKTQIIIQVKEGELVVSGKMLSNISTSPETIQFRGMKGSPMLNAWEELKRIALLLGAELTYKVR